MLASCLLACYYVQRARHTSTSGDAPEALSSRETIPCNVALSHLLLAACCSLPACSKSLNARLRTPSYPCLLAMTSAWYVRLQCLLLASPQKVEGCLGAKSTAFQARTAAPSPLQRAWRMLSWQRCRGGLCVKLPVYNLVLFGEKYSRIRVRESFATILSIVEYDVTSNVLEFAEGIVLAFLLTSCHCLSLANLHRSVKLPSLFILI